MQTNRSQKIKCKEKEAQKKGAKKEPTDSKNNKCKKPKDVL